jgi:nitrous oxide reductase accessory protein NosL
MLCFFFISPAVSIAVAGSAPAPGRLPLASDGSLQVSEEDRCPVCAMIVSKNPKFASAIQLTDGTTYYFCGTGCMIRSWLHPEAFLGRQASELRRPVVQEYFTGQALNALEVEWVAGSDVIGPMGPALVPLKDKTSVEAFRKRHGGKTTFRLEELDDARWEAITGKKALPR